MFNLTLQQKIPSHNSTRTLTNLYPNNNNSHLQDSALLIVETRQKLEKTSKYGHNFELVPKQFQPE
jgi:hypothetical protein